jgi:hypothetical protein
MGSTNFEQVYWGDESLREAYAEATSQAEREHGDSYYSGTIATTYGVSQVLPAHTMTADGAGVVSGWLNEGLAGKRTEAMGIKGGHALAIAIADDGAFTFSTKTLTFTLDELQRFIESGAEGYDNEWMRKERANAARQRPETFLWEFAAARVSEAFPLHTVHAVERSYTPKIKLVTRRSQVKSTTMYEVVDARGSVVASEPTRVLANARIKIELSEDAPRHVALGVRVVKHHSDIPGGASSIVERQVASAKITLKVTLATRKAAAPKGTKRGWLFYGMASV